LQKITYLDIKDMHWDLHSFLLRSYKLELPPITAGLPEYKNRKNSEKDNTMVEKAAVFPLLETMTA